MAIVYLKPRSIRQQRSDPSHQLGYTDGKGRIIALLFNDECCAKTFNRDDSDDLTTEQVATIEVIGKKLPGINLFQPAGTGSAGNIVGFNCWSNFSQQVCQLRKQTTMSRRLFSLNDRVELLIWKKEYESVLQGKAKRKNSAGQKCLNMEASETISKAAKETI